MHGIPVTTAVCTLVDLAGKLTRDELEAAISATDRLRLADPRRSAAAGLALPETARHRNGFKVDFIWPELGLVVETDGLRYHRTPAQQAADSLRDHAHAAAGLTPLRFTHDQIAFTPAHVRETLTAVAERLADERRG